MPLPWRSTITGGAGEGEAEELRPGEGAGRTWGTPWTLGISWQLPGEELLLGLLRPPVLLPLLPALSRLLVRLLFPAEAEAEVPARLLWGGGVFPLLPPLFVLLLLSF